MISVHGPSPQNRRHVKVYVETVRNLFLMLGKDMEGAVSATVAEAIELQATLLSYSGYSFAHEQDGDSM